jgi:hypothetical protein
MPEMTKDSSKMLSGDAREKGFPLVGLMGE